MNSATRFSFQSPNVMLSQTRLGRSASLFFLCPAVHLLEKTSPVGEVERWTCIASGMPSGHPGTACVGIPLSAPSCPGTLACGALATSAPCCCCCCCCVLFPPKNLVAGVHERPEDVDGVRTIPKTAKADRHADTAAYDDRLRTDLRNSVNQQHLLQGCRRGHNQPVHRQSATCYSHLECLAEEVKRTLAQTQTHTGPQRPRVQDE